LTDAGAVVNIPFYITRSTGSISLGNQANTATFANCDVFSKCSNFTYNKIQGTIAAGSNVAFAFYNSASGGVGNITLTDTVTTYATTSDARLKENDAPFTRGREIVDRLPIKQFTWRDYGASDIGVFAQEVADIYPRAVVRPPTDDDTISWGVDYSKYVPLLIQALQQAFKEIDALKTQVSALEGPRI
jgi:hypothetical protein